MASSRPGRSKVSTVRIDEPLVVVLVEGDVRRSARRHRSSRPRALDRGLDRELARDELTQDAGDPLDIRVEHRHRVVAPRVATEPEQVDGFAPALGKAAGVGLRREHVHLVEHQRSADEREQARPVVGDDAEHADALRELPPDLDVRDARSIGTAAADDRRVLRDRDVVEGLTIPLGHRRAKSRGGIEGERGAHHRGMMAIERRQGVARAFQGRVFAYVLLHEALHWSSRAPTLAPPRASSRCPRSVARGGDSSRARRECARLRAATRSSRRSRPRRSRRA